jgi:hypothetical protein
MSKIGSKKRSGSTPRLAPLQYGKPYCELCRDPLKVGEPVSWWRVPGAGGRRRWAVYCATCHSACARAGKPLLGVREV